MRAGEVRTSIGYCPVAGFNIERSDSAVLIFKCLVLHLHVTSVALYVER